MPVDDNLIHRHVSGTLGPSAIGGLPVARPGTLSYSSPDTSTGMLALQLPVFGLFGFGEALHGEAKAGEKEAQKRLDELEAEAQELGGTLGDLVTLPSKIFTVFEDTRRTMYPMIPRGCGGAKYDAGLALVIPVHLFDPSTMIVNFAAVAVFVKKGGNNSTLLHEYMHALNNLDDRDFQEDFGISDDEEHGVKDAIATYIVSLTDGVSPDVALGLNLTKAKNPYTDAPFGENEQAAFHAIAKHFGMSLPLLK